MTDQLVIRIGIPNGNSMKEALQGVLIKRFGWSRVAQTIQAHYEDRYFVTEVRKRLEKSLLVVQFVVLRPKDMAERIGRTLHGGILGRDCLAEKCRVKIETPDVISPIDVEIAMEFSELCRTSVRLFTRRYHHLPPIPCIVSEYPYLARLLMLEKGYPNINCEEIDGSSEAIVACDKGVDGAVDLVQTKRTVENHNLKVRKPVLLHSWLVFATKVHIGRYLSKILASIDDDIKIVNPFRH